MPRDKWEEEKGISVTLGADCARLSLWLARSLPSSKAPGTTSQVGCQTQGARMDSDDMGSMR